MLLGVVLVGRALEERAKLQASADMAALQVRPRWVSGNEQTARQFAAGCRALFWALVRVTWRGRPPVGACLPCSSKVLCSSRCAVQHVPCPQAPAPPRPRLGSPGPAAAQGAHAAGGWQLAGGALRVGGSRGPVDRAAGRPRARWVQLCCIMRNVGFSLSILAFGQASTASQQTLPAAFLQAHH